MKLEAHVRLILEVFGPDDLSEVGLIESHVFPTSFTFVRHKNMEGTISDELEWHFIELLPDSIKKISGFVEVIAEFWGWWGNTADGEGDSSCELRAIRHRQLSKDEVNYFELDQDVLFGLKESD